MSDDARVAACRRSDSLSDCADDRSRVLTFCRADELRVQPTRWLIEGWLAYNSLAGLIGASGSCKSLLALQWACSVATGNQWLGKRVDKGAVFYLAGEGNSGLRKRIAGWEVVTGKSIKKAPLFLSDRLPVLCDRSNAESVISEIVSVAEGQFFKNGDEPALIILDTLARTMEGYDENSSLDMGLFIEAMERIRTRWNCCVLSIHHTGHGPGRQARARGSSAYHAALDSVFALGVADKGVTLRSIKAKDWTDPVSIKLDKREVAVELSGDGPRAIETTVVLVGEEVGISAEKDREAREQVIALAGSGLAERQIAAQVGISKSTVNRWLQEDRKYSVEPSSSSRRTRLPQPHPLKGDGAVGQKASCPMGQKAWGKKSKMGQAKDGRSPRGLDAGPGGVVG